MDMDSYVLEYFDNNAKKLHSVVDKIIRKFAWITDKDLFYSLADEVFYTAMNNYDGVRDFDGFMYVILSNKIMTEITRMNCMKRGHRKKDSKFREPDISIYSPVPGTENCTVGDLLAAKSTVEDELFAEEECMSPQMEKYLSNLSVSQRKTIELLALEYKPWEIKKILHISDIEYADNLLGIFRDENTEIIRGLVYRGK